MKKAFLFVLMLPIVLNIGCALGNRSESESGTCLGESSETTSQRHTAYNSTLRAYLKTQVCTQCHGDGAGAPYPMVSSDDTAAYGAGRQLVDLDIPANSRMPAKIRSGHNCQGANCNAIADEIVKQIEAWRSKESGIQGATCSSHGTQILTPAIPIDTSKLVTDSDTPIRWNLAEINGSFGNIAFQLGVRKFAPVANTQPAYQVWRPILATESKKLRVERILLYFNGILDSTAQNFLGVNFVVEPKPFNYDNDSWGTFPAISQAMKLRLITQPTDTIGVSLSLTETTDSATIVKSLSDCKNRNAFDGPVQNAILANRCQNCHSAGQNGYSKYPMFGAGVNTCRETLLRSDTANPENSYLLNHIQDANHGGGVINLSSSEIGAITTWLNGELAAGN